MKYSACLLCLFLLSGCGAVAPIGRFNCPDGTYVDYVQATASNPTGTTTLVAIDRYRTDPKINKTTLIRSDASGLNTGKPWDFLKEIPLPLLIP